MASFAFAVAARKPAKVPFIIIATRDAHIGPCSLHLIDMVNKAENRDLVLTVKNRKRFIQINTDVLEESQFSVTDIVEQDSFVALCYVCRAHVHIAFESVFETFITANRPEVWSGRAPKPVLVPDGIVTKTNGNLIPSNKIESAGLRSWLIGRAARRITYLSQSGVENYRICLNAGIRSPSLIRTATKRLPPCTKKLGVGSFFPVATMTALFKDIRPRIVVATNSPRSEKAAITAAGDLGIPSLCLVDMFALLTVDWLIASDYATRVCVLNDRVRDLFIRKNRPAEHVVVTGNPAFDKLRDRKIQAAGHALRGARGGSRKDCVLLYASSPETPTHATTGALSDLLLPHKVEDALFDIVSCDPALMLVIRRHPSENQDVELGPRIFQSTMADAIDPLLHAVDVVVVTASTVGFQGHLAGRPVVSVECSAVSPNVPYGAFGIARAVDDIADIGPALAACVADAKSTATCVDRDQVFAADLVLEQILPLLEEVA